MKALRILAAHNEWANRKLFDACAEISAAKLTDDTPPVYRPPAGAICTASWATYGRCR